MTSPRPLLSVAEAAAAFDVTKRTLQRRLAAGDLAGATKDPDGRWKIPIEALHAASFAARQGTTDDTTPAPSVAPTPTNPSETRENSASSDATEAASLRAILRDTQQQLDAERHRREAAEQNANDLRTALRMLEAGTVQPPAPQQPAQRRRWWQRRGTVTG